MGMASELKANVISLHLLHEIAEITFLKKWASRNSHHRTEVKYDSVNRSQAAKHEFSVNMNSLTLTMFVVNPEYFACFT